VIILDDPPGPEIERSPEDEDAWNSLCGRLRRQPVEVTTIEIEAAASDLALHTRRRDELTRQGEALKREAAAAAGDARLLEQGLEMKFESHRFDEPE